jgi:hypothetical protein
MALVAAMTLLSGCATAPSKLSVCPPVVNYSREFMVKAADELDAIPAGSAIDRMMQDYGTLRAQLRACQ